MRFEIVMPAACVPHDELGHRVGGASAGGVDDTAPIDADEQRYVVMAAFCSGFVMRVACGA